MRIRYFSDLHLEFINQNKIKEFLGNIKGDIYDICVLAGDIGNPYEYNYDIFMNFINKNFKRSFVILGNHEYYNKTKTMQETIDYVTQYFKQFNNICFLNNTYELYEGYCFIGTTLWSKIINPYYVINDIYKIPNLDYMEYNRLNMLSVNFLEEVLKSNENCIIITHHVPLYSLINIKYKSPRMIPYNQWFYCDLDYLMEIHNDKIKYWFYGHTHTPEDTIINGIHFLCNPIGYPNENEKVNFQNTITI